MMKVNLSANKKHTISPYLFMQFLEPLGTADSSVDAGWDYLNDCWQPKLVDMVKKLAPPMIRFGGCFASYYHWKEAVGTRNERIPMLNLCWDGIFSNQVGTDEIVSLCRRADAEPLFVVNMESDGRMYWAYPKDDVDRLGTSTEAAEWVDYCNNPDNKLRRKHGIENPYNIRFWQIGNETSYDKRGFDKNTAAFKTLEFAERMREADNSIKLIAWGDDGWTAQMCETVGDKIDYISFHHHFNSGLPDSPLKGTDYRIDPDNTWRHLMNSYRSLETAIERMRSEAAPYGKRLAMTEGHFAIPGRNRCEVLSAWGAGVAYARCFNTIERAADILDIATMADFFGNRWQVNALMIPTPARNDNAYFQPVGEIMRLFRHHIGSHAVEFNTNESNGIDITASISDSGDKIFVHVINTDCYTSKKLDITVDGKLIKSITAYEIAADPTAEVTSLTPDIFSPVEFTVSDNTYTIPRAAVTVLEILIEN